MKIIRLTHSLKYRSIFNSSRYFSTQYMTYSKRKTFAEQMYPFMAFKENCISCKNFWTSVSAMKIDKNALGSEGTESVHGDPYIIDTTNRLYRHPGMPHNVLVIQPRLKSGPQRETVEVSELKLAEAAALVNTLPRWKVAEKHIISVTSLSSKFIFTSGNLEKIKLMIRKDLKVSAVFIGVDIMTALQNSSLEEYLKVPVFDRYQIILQIFHDHAHTKEAKLQLALAEIPYLRVKLAGFSHTRDSSYFSGIHHVGGEGETFMEKRKRILNEREVKLKKELQKIKDQRQLLRQNERRQSLPVIAVVGYTNCGKTSLIKALTNDARLNPEDKLFATLDVTLHAGLLPSNQKVLFIDTVGFISDVPTALIQSFRATLEEVNLADLVIHVRDISHPDTEHQNRIVQETLREIDLPEKLLNSILEVRNKIDLLRGCPDDSSEALYISATKGIGLPQLLEVAEQRLFENTGHTVSLMRIPNGGPEYSWLMKEGGIQDAIADAKDSSYLIVEVVLSTAMLQKFKHKFGDLTVSVDDILH